MSFSFTSGYEDYAKFPMHYLRVTQSYNAGNHKAHWDGANYKDYPVDLGGMDSGKDYLYAPVDMKIVALNGIGSKSVSNKIFLESVDKVQTVKHGKTKIFMTAVHFNDSDVSKFGLKVGKVIKAGQAICFEGTETATANHLHFTCGVGSAKSSIENNNKKWVTKGDCKKPEEIFYIDSSFTKVMNKGGLNWQELPPLEEKIQKIGTPVSRDTTKNQIEVSVSNLRVRDSASTSGKILGYINKGIYNYTETKTVNNYTWYNIGIGWIAYSNSWCTVYEKKEIKEELNPIPPETNDSPNLEENDKNDVIDQEQQNNEKNDVSDSEEVISILQKIIDFVRKLINLIKK